ncbi:MAG: phosphoribosylformylglycinamidine synthase, partial [Gemmatimonadetes bacterium]|nr:phosphoribosylformylglycinamidine synthase [Gemmatimonadota bacterium]
AQQQCTGPLGLTVSNLAVVAQSHFGVTGGATSIGEQPIKGLIDPAAMARMSVAEALTNIVWARVSALEDVRCSANWMWAAKLPGEGAHIYDAAVAMSEFMSALGIAVDGGKDSLSMASMDRETGEIVKAPGSLVISAYVTSPDITKTVTPDIKRPGRSKLLYIDLGGGKYRLGGSALAQCFGQLGDETPDIEDPALLKRAFNAVQELIEEGLILAGHDISDGGLITAALEMAFAGNSGLEIDIKAEANALEVLFAEEAGLLIEYSPDYEEKVLDTFNKADVAYQLIGETTEEKVITVSVNETVVLDDPLEELRAVWEETSYRLDRLQANPECVEEERKNVYSRPGPRFTVSFEPEETPEVTVRPKVAIVREEGSNGDREMTSAFYAAGFEPWDITITDIMEGRAALSDMRGVVFVGGFSYADVLDSAKGWGGVIRFNEKVRAEFD